LRTQNVLPNVDISSPVWIDAVETDWYGRNAKHLEGMLRVPYHSHQTQYLWLRDSLSPDARHGNWTVSEYFPRFMRAAFRQAIDARDVELAERILRKEFFTQDPVMIARWAWLENNNTDRILQVLEFVRTEIDPRQHAIWALSGLHDEFLYRGRFADEPIEWLYQAITVPRAIREYRHKAALIPETIDEHWKLVNSGEAYYRRYLESELAGTEEEQWMARRYWQGELFLGYVTTQRLVTVQLAAIAWLRDHPGESLTTLDRLVPDYLPEIPKDPHTAEHPIFDNDFVARAYPTSIWPQPEVPTTSMFVFTPGGNGAAYLRAVVRAFRDQGYDLEILQHLSWGYNNQCFRFQPSDMIEHLGVRASVCPSVGEGRVFPIRLDDGAQKHSE
jgi:hypothetical protein